jgi:hypothetical protein
MQIDPFSSPPTSPSYRRLTSIALVFYPTWVRTISPSQGSFRVCLLGEATWSSLLILDKNGFASEFESLDLLFFPDKMRSRSWRALRGFRIVCDWWGLLSQRPFSPLSSPSIARLKARWQNWRLPWNLTWRRKARGRCKSGNTLWRRKAWRRVGETGGHEGLRSTISSLRGWRASRETGWWSSKRSYGRRRRSGLWWRWDVLIVAIWYSTRRAKICIHPRYGAHRR